MEDCNPSFSIALDHILSYLNSTTDSALLLRLSYQCLLWTLVAPAAARQLLRHSLPAPVAAIGTESCRRDHYLLPQRYLLRLVLAKTASAPLSSKHDLSCASGAPHDSATPRHAQTACSSRRQLLLPRFLISVLLLLLL
jgi:hypothetical protein